MDSFAFTFSTWLGLVIFRSSRHLSLSFRSRLSIGFSAKGFDLLTIHCRHHPYRLVGFTSDRFTGISEDGRIVVDEMAGAALFRAFVRPRDHWKTALLLIGYLAIDGIKPWPISATEALTGAYGVMADDLMIAVRVAIFLIQLRLWQARRN